MPHPTILRRLLAVATVSTLPAIAAQAATVTVTSTADSITPDGHVTLREAIASINAGEPVNGDVAATGAWGAADTIGFGIAGGGVQTIVVGGSGVPLPTIVKPVLIDGTTQSGSSPNTLAVGSDAVLNLVLRGVTPGLHGLEIGTGGDGSTIQGLVLQKHFFAIQIAASAVVVRGNFIGTDPTGTSADSSTTNSIAINVTHGNVGGNTIGGPAPADRNVLSGNGSAVVMNSQLPNSVLGNYVGVDASGTVALPNSGTGIAIGTLGVATIGGPIIGGVTATPGQGAGNVISGNGSRGIQITTTLGSTTIGAGTIEGNILGLDATGTTAIPNTGANIYLYDTNLPSDGVPRIGPITIGGSAAGAGNVLAAGGHGIFHLAGGTVIRGNKIGTDITGALARPNTFGLEITGVSTAFVGSATVGGTGPEDGNVISGNLSDAIRVFLSTATIQGNRIGVSVDGAGLANGGHGIFVDSGLATIGGTVAGAGNVIANSGQYGVQVRIGFPGVHAASEAYILGNSISASALLAINNSAPDVVTPNDPGDGDTGPNGLQNFPVLTAGEIAGSSVAVSGSLDSAPSGLFRVEVFSNATCDGFGHGEGATYLGFVDVSTDAGGLGAFGPISLPIPPGEPVLTATATDAAGHTSELSACLTASTPPPPSLSVDDCTVLEGNTGTTDCTFSVTASQTSAGTMEVDYQTANITASAPGDFVAASGTLTFAPGETVKTVQVAVVGDLDDEPDEDFNLGIFSPVGATVADGVGQGVILDDDGPGQVFADGFESGATGAWSGASPR